MPPAGALRPIEEKGALLSIDTAELEAWWDKVKDAPGIEIKNGIITGADGMIEQFSLYDPGRLHRRILPLERPPPGSATLP